MSSALISFIWRSGVKVNAHLESVRRISGTGVAFCKRSAVSDSSDSSSTSNNSSNLERELYLGQKVVRLIFNAEKRRNVLTLDFMNTLCKELKEINEIENLRAVILAAKGPAFSSGHDLKELTMESGVNHHKLVFKRATELAMIIQSMKLPVIAEVNNVAAAAGCQLVSSCDMVIASPKAKFMVNGLNVGLFCSTPGIPLVRNIPRKLAMDMLLTGRAIDANEALQAGLVSRLVASEADVTAEALKACEQICSMSRSVIALGKAFFHAQVELGNVHHAYRQGEAVMCENLKMVDAQNGIQAFISKTKPEWTHSDNKAI